MEWYDILLCFVACWVLVGVITTILILLNDIFIIKSGIDEDNYKYIPILMLLGFITFIASVCILIEDIICWVKNMFRNRRKKK